VGLSFSVAPDVGPLPGSLMAIRFFGSRPFNRANDLLTGQGGQPMDWRLP